MGKATADQLLREVVRRKEGPKLKVTVRMLAKSPGRGPLGDGYQTRRVERDPAKFLDEAGTKICRIIWERKLLLGRNLKRKPRYI